MDFSKYFSNCAGGVGEAAGVDEGGEGGAVWGGGEEELLRLLKELIGSVRLLGMYWIIKE